MLGQPVNEWISERRSEGLSWRLIARALYERTGCQVDVTHETIRGWAHHEDKAA